MHGRHGELPGLDQFHRVEADREQQITALEEIPYQRIAGHVERAGVIRVVLGEHALGHRRHHHRHAQRFGQPGKRAMRSRALRGDAGEHRGAPGCTHPLRDVRRGVLERDYLRRRIQRFERRQHHCVIQRLGADHIGVRGDMHRAGTLGHRRAQRFSHHDTDRVGRHMGRPLAHRREDPIVVEHLVRERLFALALDLAGDGDHRNPVEPRARNCIDKVRRTRTECRHAHPRAPGEKAVRLGHQACSAFAPPEHELHAGTARSLHEFDVRVAGIAEDVADARRREVLDHHLRYIHGDCLDLELGLFPGLEGQHLDRSVSQRSESCSSNPDPRGANDP